jgi:Flp pilus assembly protein TadG
MVETAIALPLLLLVCIGIVEFGRAYQTWQVLTNAAREGARVAILPEADDATVVSRVQTYLTAGQLPRAAQATIDIQRNQAIQVWTGTQVTVSYPFEFIVLQPIARMVVGGSDLGSPMTIAASATMRNE